MRLVETPPFRLCHPGILEDPGLIEINGPLSTTHSDTYSFTLLVLKYITEETLFSYLARDAAMLSTRGSVRLDQMDNTGGVVCLTVYGNS